ncbi:YheC/YheD family protein [Ammoniphilus resinae]|uniref:YheC/YheD family protein n=1 Tax=Ammoniphilus resinae TaxID=861532 RepID=A0ABS4GUS7_9BACL|nr:YheC/YheD family protein [Ammoniphilus resinae]MBP1933817.1 hypothetical protein [Ammoniphilus resinae]
MEYFFEILSDNETMNRLCLPSMHAERLGIQDRKQLLLTFGTKSVPVELKSDAISNHSTLRISTSILEQLQLPSFPRYQIRWRESKLIIGPYIGILVSHTHSFLDNHIQILSSFIQNYEQLGGAILAFSLEGVNPNDRLIRGFLYNPYAKRWEKGTYAYPTALFSILEEHFPEHRNDLHSILKHFYGILGKRVFNFPTINKWEMHQWLQQYPLIHGYLPDTLLYNEPKEIHQMLKKHQIVCIRPVHAHPGLCLLKAEKVRNGVAVRYQNKDQSQQVLLRNRKQFFSFFQKHLTPHEYLIQEAIDLPTIKGRNVDFRLSLVKDGKGEWTNLGIFGRYGEKKSMTGTDGYVESGKLTLQKVLALGHEGAVSWNEWMTYLSVQAARAMEEYGSHYGNLGLDLALDKRKRLWLLEINSEKPTTYIAPSAGKEELLQQTRQMSMLYCKRLAGF